MSKYVNEEEEELRVSNKGMFEKFLNKLGFEAEEVIEEELAESQEEIFPINRDRDNGKVVSLANSNKPVKMIISGPKSFEEVQVIVDHLKTKKAVILNLEETDKVVARRIADFLGGAVYALEGSMQEISSSIFLFTPAHIEVALPFKQPENKERERYHSGAGAAVSNSYKSDRD